MKEEGSPEVPHHHKVKPVFVKGHCGFKDQLEAEKAVGELLWESGLTIHRIKGVLCLDDCDYVLELQGVEDLFEIKETKSSVKIYKGESRVLVIGEDIDPALIHKSLAIA